MGSEQQYLLELNRLPEEILVLLKQNLNSKFGSYTGFFNYLEQYSFVASQFKLNCIDIDPEGRSAVLFKSLGWKGIFQRIFKIFYLEAEEILHRAEASFAPFSIDGNYRYMLPFFYSITEGDASINYDLQLFLEDQKTLDYFKILRQRTAKIDYILICLFLFESFLGHSEVVDILTDGGYDTLYTKLTMAQQKVFQESLLHYSYSINDALFFEDVV